MFNLFRKKLKDVVEKFSKKAEEEAEEVVSEAEEKKDKPKKRFSIFRKKPKEEIKEEPAEEEGGAPEEAVEEEIKEESKESFEKKHEEESSIEREKPKKSFFEKIKGITRVKISEEKFEKLFEDLETVLLENNVAFDVIDKIKEDLKVDLVNVPIQNVRKAVRGSLINSLDGILSFTEIDLVKRAKQKKPYIILFVGVNGAGKTTTMAKLADLFLKNNLRCVFAAADTFRAASIQQLEEHGKKLGVHVIRHDYGADPAAVAYDGIKHAEAKGLDVVLIDTAGRQHNNENLMQELEKVNRIAKPDFKIFVGESIAGNDLVEQVNRFNEIVRIDGIILSKFDVDDKGGAAISVSYATTKPILYFGVGQRYDDLEKFDKNKIISSLNI
ncbi:signal recognition particle-docking protein FtsY [Candidatus Woesearchaeota archaeon]|nr:signal recognition particle-docking protein FtsY [Candidatus Woesearchaeota archaeon]